MKENADNTQDPTVVVRKARPGHALIVSYTDDSGILVVKRMDSSFCIGRDDSCQIQILGEVVSKKHVEIQYRQSGWWVCDLDSTNGTFLDGKRIQQVNLKRSGKVRIAPDGPVLGITFESELRRCEDDTPLAKTKPVIPVDEQANTFEQNGTNKPTETKTDSLSQTHGSSSDSALEHPPQAIPTKETRSVSDVIRRYFSDETSDAGMVTMMFREAFSKARSRFVKRFWIALGVVLALLSVTLFVIFVRKARIDNLRKVAVEIFYNMKAIEVQMEEVLVKLKTTGDLSYRTLIEEKRKQLDSMNEKYNRFIEKLGVFGKNIAREERLILRMARLFGECEINIPKGFLSKVKEYIRRWKSSQRLERAIKRAVDRNYPSRVFQIMVNHHLPPQFFYLGIQESNFDLKAIGPETRFGIAKGVWQFIPSTAVKYGLKTGPLVNLREYDPLDERFNFDKSTIAAAKYLRDIYGTEAQASGLLVIASYNWGHHNIRRRILELPAQPRERNFWKLLEKYKIPDETYNYVFGIFSAAVIGEDPALFGFDFENPLQGLDETLETEQPAPGLVNQKTTSQVP